MPAVTTQKYSYPAKATPNIPTIEEFKTRVTNPLLTSLFIVTFAGPYFDTVSADKILQCKAQSMTVPNYQINNEQVYMGGTEASVPNGLTKGNLDMTIINQGKEYDIIYNWMVKNYNPTTRTYGYYDDIRTKIFVTQYATNGIWVLEHQYSDCTPYNLQMGQLSYSESGLSTFTLQLNFFSYVCIYNTGYEQRGLSKNVGPISYFEGVNQQNDANGAEPSSVVSYTGTNGVVINGVTLSPGTKYENGVYVGPNTATSNYDGTNGPN